jgi:hypothetical protein
MSCRKSVAAIVSVAKKKRCDEESVISNKTQRKIMQDKDHVECILTKANKNIRNESEPFFAKIVGSDLIIRGMSLQAFGVIIETFTRIAIS